MGVFVLLRIGIWLSVLAGVGLLAAAWWVFSLPQPDGALEIRNVLATEQAARWAVLGVLGALLGNVLLFLNLRIAAEATDAAKIAANLARDAVDHARQSSLLELRPYVFGVGTHFHRFVTDGRITSFKVGFKWKNGGATPARNVVLAICWQAEEAGFDWRRFHFPVPQEKASDVGDMGSDIEFINNCTPIPEEILLDLVLGMKSVVVWGSCEYDGLEPGVRHRTERAVRVLFDDSELLATSDLSDDLLTVHNGADANCMYLPVPPPAERPPVRPAPVS